MLFSTANLHHCSASSNEQNHHNSYHMKNFRWQIALSHPVPALTLFTFNDTVSVYSFTHTNTSPTYDSWTVNFPSSCTLDTHYSTQCIIFHCSQTWIDFSQVSEAFVATASLIRVSAMLLLLIVGNWNLRCFGDLQMYYVIYRDIRSEVSTFKANRHTSSQPDRQYSNMQYIAWLSRKESFLKSKLVTSPCYSCVCLSVCSI